MRTRAGSGGPPVREREFHAWLEAHLPAGRSGLLPLGDDAAALRPPPGTVAVLSTDALVEGTHFLADSPPGRVGAAAAAVSLSDVAAKGARPAAVVIATLVPPGSPVRWVRDALLGAERLAARYGAHVVGGDTKPSPVRSLVSTVVGWGRPGRLMPRTGARPGDRLVTTGEVGRGGLAAWGLAHGPAPRSRRLAALLEVRPRVAEGVALAGFAHAALDTSDGLADSAALLAAASGVRVEVDERTLPLARGLLRLGVDRRTRRAVALYGGDYELLAAVPRARLAGATRAVVRAGGRLTVVGRVLPGRGAHLVVDGVAGAMPAAGWRPFEGPPTPPAVSGP
jgi:thiamine-monophosphate kinase